jgi:hypothetical protein
VITCHAGKDTRRVPVTAKSRARAAAALAGAYTWAGKRRSFSSDPVTSAVWIPGRDAAADARAVRPTAPCGRDRGEYPGNLLARSPDPAVAALALACLARSHSPRAARHLREAAKEALVSALVNDATALVAALRPEDPGNWRPRRWRC